ncbi:hypothetical protein ATCC90586_005970 [Pythium insidiosum]|nr:hypothetical protein ATCC90586_005970 [Pythium insidiosum]
MTRGAMRQRVLEVTQTATQSGALKRIIAGHQLLPADRLGVQCILFSALAQYRRPGGYAVVKPQVVGPDASAPRREFFDPFARENVERDLYIAPVFDDHFLVLNKFAVVDEHVVLATVEFAEQEQPLTASDLRAVWTSMHALDAFAFFNCGYESGASQPHKHMQLISYSSVKQFCGLDMPPLLDWIHRALQRHPSDKAVQLPELPFHHYLHRLELPDDDGDAVSSHETAERLLEIYSGIMSQMNACEYARPAPEDASARGQQPIAYNLLLTRSFLFVIPRKTPAFDGIEVNSIGFIGSFFERNDEQLAFFSAHGGLELLQRVTFPPRS